MDIGDSKPKKQVPNMITHRSPNSLFWGVSWCLERISIGMPVSGDGDPGFQAKFLNKAQKKIYFGNAWGPYKWPSFRDCVDAT